MNIGIPRALFYYYNTEIVVNFFKNLGFNVILSDKTTKETIENGKMYGSDEMCISAKNYIGHVYDLIDKVDYVLIPRIDNYYTFNQTCTNFLALRDIIANTFKVNILEYNIDLNNNQSLDKGLYEIGKKLKKKDSDIKNAYSCALDFYNNLMKKRINNNIKKLNSNKTKVLLMSHSYNTYDNMIGIPITELLKEEDIEIIYSDLFDSDECIKIAENKYKDLYWKYSKEMIGAYELSKDKINGIIFLSTFPCGLDSLVNELLILNLNMPYLNIVLDDLSGDNGIETRIESFLDILKKFR